MASVVDHILAILAAPPANMRAAMTWSAHADAVTGTSRAAQASPVSGSVTARTETYVRLVAGATTYNVPHGAVTSLAAGPH
jgi:hypothetical protein